MPLTIVMKIMNKENLKKLVNHLKNLKAGRLIGFPIFDMLQIGNWETLYSEISAKSLIGDRGCALSHAFFVAEVQGYDFSYKTLKEKYKDQWSIEDITKIQDTKGYTPSEIEYMHLYFLFSYDFLGIKPFSLDWAFLFNGRWAETRDRAIYHNKERQLDEAIERLEFYLEHEDIYDKTLWPIGLYDAVSKRATVELKEVTHV